MRSLTVLWAGAMGAIGGAILYVTGRQDGQKEGLVVGYVAGSVEAANAMAEQEQPEVAKDKTEQETVIH